MTTIIEIVEVGAGLGLAYVAAVAAFALALGAVLGLITVVLWLAKWVSR